MDERTLQRLSGAARLVQQAITREEDDRHSAGQDRLFPPTVEQAAGQLADELDSAYLDVVANPPKGGLTREQVEKYAS